MQSAVECSQICCILHTHKFSTTYIQSPAAGPKHKFRHFSTSVDIAAAGDSTAK